MERKLKRQQRIIGAVVKIPLENGFHSYARILEDECAFYDIHAKEDIEIEHITNNKILFWATVYDIVITKGYWLKVGKKLPLEKRLLNMPPIYTQDILNPDRFTIYDNNGQHPATKEECVGLEYFRVWTHTSIEKRLSDHYAGKENPELKRILSAEKYPTPDNRKNTIIMTSSKNKEAV